MRLAAALPVILAAAFISAPVVEASVGAVAAILASSYDGRPRDDTAAVFMEITRT